MTNFYWYGGSGNWSDYTNHWSYNSGNSPAAPAANVPTSADNVITDGNSNATAYTLTVDATATCADLTLGNPASGVLTLAGSAGMDLYVYGSLALTSGMTASYNGTLYFKATAGTKTITTNAVSLNCEVDFNGVGGTFQAADNITQASNKYWKFVNGTFDPNGKLVTFSTSGDITSVRLFGASNFYDLIITGTAYKTNTFTPYANVTITHNFTITGNSATNRVLVTSDTIGTARTITVNGAVSVTNADFRDITGAGSASWDISAGNNGGGTLSGCSGITFTTPSTQYWVHPNDASSHNWSESYWFTTSGGAVAGHVPLLQDTARFDALSFPHSGDTVVQDMPRIGSVDWTGATNTPTFTTSTVASVFGSVTLISGMTLTASTQTYTLEGRGAYTLTSSGKTWGKVLYLYAPSGSLTLQDSITSTSTTDFLTVGMGTFNANGQNVTAPGVYSSYSGQTRAIVLGSGVWSLTSSDALAHPWSCGTVGNLTVTSTGSTISFTNTSASNKTFDGGGLSYNSLQFTGSGTGNYIITGTNTFTGTLSDTGTAVHSITLPNVTTTVADFQRGAGTNVITLQRTGASGTFTLAKSGGGTINLPYMSISNSTASPTGTWYAPQSTDGGGNTNWIFTCSPYPFINPGLCGGIGRWLGGGLR